MHWEGKKLGLPIAGKGKEWKLAFATDAEEKVEIDSRKVKFARSITLPPRSIAVLVSEESPEVLAEELAEAEKRKKLAEEQAAAENRKKLEAEQAAVENRKKLEAEQAAAKIGKRQRRNRNITDRK